MKNKNYLFIRAAILAVAMCRSLSSQTITWNNTAGGEWGTAGNWTGGVLPASGDIALFNSSIGGNITNGVADQSLGGISFGTSSSSVNIGSTSGNQLAFTHGGSIQNLSTLTGSNKTMTINSPFLLKSATPTTAGSFTIANNNTTASNTLVINGAIRPDTTTSSFTLNLGGPSSASGANQINGLISNGNAMGGLNLNKTGLGSWQINNNANSFTGTVAIQGVAIVSTIGNEGSTSALGTNKTITLGSGSTAGQISYKGAGETTDKVINMGGTTGGATISSSGATGGLVINSDLQVSTNGAKTLTLDSTISGNAFNGLIADSAAGATSLTVTGQAGGVWELGNSSNSFSGQVLLQNGQASVATIGNSGANSALGKNGTIKLGNGTQTGTVLYTGTGETSNKVLDLNGTTGGGTLDQSGTGHLKLTSDMTSTGAGSKTLTLKGSGTGTGEIAGKIVDNSAANKTSITKSGTGRWTLSGDNTYTGTTTISGGTLVVNGVHTGAGAYTIQNTGTLAGNAEIYLEGTAGITANSGAAIAPGENGEIGTLNLDGAGTTGAILTMKTGSGFKFDLDGSGGGTDQVSLWNYVGSSDFILNNNAVDLTLSGTITNGSYTKSIFTFYSDSGVTSTNGNITSGLTFGSIDSNISSYSFVYNANSIDVAFSVVPEVSSASSLIVGCFLVLGAMFIRSRRGVSEGV